MNTVLSKQEVDKILFPEQFKKSFEPKKIVFKTAEVALTIITSRYIGLIASCLTIGVAVISIASILSTKNEAIRKIAITALLISLITSGFFLRSVATGRLLQLFSNIAFNPNSLNLIATIKTISTLWKLFFVFQSLNRVTDLLFNYTTKSNWKKFMNSDDFYKRWNEWILLSIISIPAINTIQPIINLIDKKTSSDIDLIIKNLENPKTGYLLDLYLSKEECAETFLKNRNEIQYYIETKLQNYEEKINSADPNAPYKEILTFGPNNLGDTISKFLFITDYTIKSGKLNPYEDKEDNKTLCMAIEFQKRWIEASTKWHMLHRPACR